MKAILVTKCGIRMSVRCKAIIDVEGLKGGLGAAGYEIWRAVWWDKDNAGCLLCRAVVSARLTDLWASVHRCGKGKV